MRHNTLLYRLQQAIRASTAEPIESKITLTDTEYRDWKWGELFAKALSAATKVQWAMAGWEEASNGWDVVLRSPQHVLTLMFSDGNFGYTLTAYRLNDYSDLSKKVVVTKVFQNNKALFDSVQDSMARLGNKTKAARNEYVLGFGVKFETAFGEPELPYDLNKVVVYKGDTDSFLIAWKTIITDDQDVVKSESDKTLKAINGPYWADGMYPPSATAFNLTTRTWPKWANAGMLGKVDGRKFVLNEKFLNEHKVKTSLRSSAEQAMLDLGLNDDDLAAINEVEDIAAGLNEAMGPKSDQGFQRSLIDFAYDENSLGLQLES